ncbi:MAG: hypothetical protein ACPGQL_04840 [Thermoplasmatota archaeon]
MANLYWPHKDQFRSREKKTARRLQAWQAAERAATKHLVFSHAFCLDGVGSAVVALRALGPEGVGVAYCQPDKMVKALRFVAEHPGRGRSLLVADLSFNPQHFDDLVEAAAAVKAAGWRIEWRDHHHKQWEGLELDRLRASLDVLTVNDDGTESGASLMQQALAPKDAFLKRFAETVRDRDIWANQLPDSETLEYAITYMGTEAFTGHFVHAAPETPVVDKTVEAAADAQKAKQADHTQRITSHARYATTANGKVGVAYGWLPKNVGLHQMIADGCAVAINVRPNGKMSIRSQKGAEVSHLIARDFNGGGHPNASGGDLGLEGLAYWMYILRKGRVRRTKEVMASAVRHLEAIGQD